MWNVIFDNVGINAMKREDTSSQEEISPQEDATEKLVDWDQYSPLSQMAFKRSGTWSEGHGDGDDNEFEEDTVSDDAQANDHATGCVSERFLSDVVKSAPPPTPCVKYNLGSKVRLLHYQMTLPVRKQYWQVDVVFQIRGIAMRAPPASRGFA